ncbi:MAG TPA: zinc-ribbon domain-containing protein [Firmicutes bacterium]|nr:zinc-ribbon domain-containing protein [Bacillota bacterium]
MSYCSHCGAKVTPGKRFCQNCGQELAGFSRIRPKRKTGIIFTLSIVLIMAAIAAEAVLLIYKYNEEDTREEQLAEHQREEQAEIKKSEPKEPAEPPGGAPVKPEGREIYAALSDQEIRSLNIFLSNFSEANFQRYDANQKYTASNSLPLINFVHMHYHFNLHDQMVGVRKGGIQYTGVSLDKLSAKLNRFFYNLNSTPAFIESAVKTSSCGYLSDGKHLLWEMADGAQINYFSQAVSLVEKKDGTLKTQIVIYQLERRMNDGLIHGEVPHWVYQPCSGWSSTNKAGVTKVGAAAATLVRYEYLGKPSYQLVKYELLTQ